MPTHDVPPLLYGTAWKEDATRGCVEQALAAGFRGIDTANQRKHYHEEGVGEALAAWLGAGPGRGERDALFVQTKFTFPGGQDHRIPYERGAAVAVQVEQSFRSSLVHLGLDRVDSYVLHGPSQHPGLGPRDREAWAAMERVHDAGGARFLGVSNVDREQLEALCDGARVPPRFVQNRCYARTGWDASVRDYCARNGITYQGFSLLTANRHVLAHTAVHLIARRRGVTPAEVVFRFALDVGMLPLTGTTDRRHMDQDLAVVASAPLTADEIATIEAIG